MPGQPYDQPMIRYPPRTALTSSESSSCSLSLRFRFPRAPPRPFPRARPPLAAPRARPFPRAPFESSEPAIGVPSAAKPSTPPADVGVACATFFEDDPFGLPLPRDAWRGVSGCDTSASLVTSVFKTCCRAASYPALSAPAAWAAFVRLRISSVAAENWGNSGLDENVEW